MTKDNFKYLFTTLLLVNFALISSGITNGLDNKSNSGISVVVIDPGHGGKDPGAAIGSDLEKNIVLDIALRLGDTIQSHFPNVKVVYTRSKDVFIPLHQRANIANKSEADLFISIHVNAVEQTYVKGAETFILGHHRSDENFNVAAKENSVILLEDNYNTTYEGFNPNQAESYIMFANMQEEYQEQSLLFAEEIQKQFKQKANRVDRSVKQAGFLVLRRTTMPGVLIETGFLSNPSERMFMASKHGRATIASSIFYAFKDYKETIEDKSNFTLISEEEDIVAKREIKKEPKKLPETKTTSHRITEKKESQKSNKPVEVDLYYSVQILALKRKAEATSANFKQEKNIFRVKGQNIYRYFTGKFNSFEEAEEERIRIEKKYQGAFVVGFRNNQLISVKKE